MVISISEEDSYQENMYIHSVIAQKAVKPFVRKLFFPISGVYNRVVIYVQPPKYYPKILFVQPPGIISFRDDNNF